MFIVNSNDSKDGIKHITRRQNVLYVFSKFVKISPFKVYRVSQKKNYFSSHSIVTYVNDIVYVIIRLFGTLIINHNYFKVINIINAKPYKKTSTLSSQVKYMSSGTVKVHYLRHFPNFLLKGTLAQFITTLRMKELVAFPE